MIDEELNVRGADDDLSSADVQSCLALLEQAWSIAERSSSLDVGRSFEGAVRSEQSDECCKQRVGRFEVRRLLGQGGFGVVFLAFDSQLGREVALKLPRPETLSSRDLRRQFAREAEAAAALDHPGILPVYDVGEIGPVTYIASALCRGPTLARWLAEQSLPVSLRVAAETAALLAEAVHHAHSRGVMHRDLKPSNVLLEFCTPQNGSPLPFTPRLTDFGLAARVVPSEAHIATFALVGTPRYTSPEQAAGKLKDIGVPTDVYALGVLLYEMLTGRPPLVGQDDTETLDRIQCQAVIPLRDVRSDVPRDLEAICLKCLRKAPAQRYPTAAELAADLRRFLEGRAVLARPISWPAHSMRWCRRRPLVAALGLLVILLIIALVGGGVAAFERERSLRLSAEWKQRFARDAVDDMYTLVAEKWLSASAASEGLRRDFLYKALRFYEELAREQSNDPEVLHEMSIALSRVANIQIHLRMVDLAVSSRRRCLEILDRLLVEFPGNEEYRYDRFYNFWLLSGELQFLGDNETSQKVFRQAFAIIRQLSDDSPTNPKYIDAMAAASSAYGNCLSESGRSDEAKEIWRRAAESAERLAAQFPNKPLYQKNIAENLALLASQLATEGNLVEAERLFARAAAIYRRLTPLFPEYSSLPLYFAKRQADRAFTLAKLGREGEAEPLLKESLSTIDMLSEKFPQDVAIQDQRHRLLWMTGHYYFKGNRPSDARRVFERCLKYMDQLVAAMPDYVVHRRVYAGYLRDCPLAELRSVELAEQMERGVRTGQ